MNSLGTIRAAAHRAGVSMAYAMGKEPRVRSAPEPKTAPAVIPRRDYGPKQ